MSERFENICWTVLAAGVLVAIMLVITGCYVGRAEFRGEDMRVYPLFTSHHATSDCSDVPCNGISTK